MSCYMFSHSLAEGCFACFQFELFTHSKYINISVQTHKHMAVSSQLRVNIWKWSFCILKSILWSSNFCVHQLLVTVVLCSRALQMCGHISAWLCFGISRILNILLGMFPVSIFQKNLESLIPIFKTNGFIA